MKKLPNGRYALQYFENESGYESGMRRPVNIIEKNKNVRGRRKQNELAINQNLNYITNKKKKQPEKKPNTNRDQKKTTRLNKNEAPIKIDHPIKYGVISVAMALPYLHSILDPLDNHVL